MVKRNRLRNGRKQALFGADGAVMAAATLAAAAINSASTMNASRQQADAVTKSAQTNADALIKQNENNNVLQEQSIAFTKEQNERNRELQKEIQMNLQLLAGQQNVNEMREAAKIQVKHGGSMRKKLRSAKINDTSLLRGRNGNLSFQVTDGGGVIPIGTTPEGYDLYEIIGNDHEHYHKAQGGKSKTGVGIRFANSSTIEGEGNQNSNQGELMLVTPDDAKFISKHSIKGYNPAQAVLAGQDPLEAFAIQEQIKNVYGINDDGKHSSKTPLRRTRTSGGPATFVITPDLSLDFLAPVATGVVAETRQLKYGGRHKADYGGPFISEYDLTRGIISDDDNLKTNNTIKTPKKLTTYQGNLIGAGINAGANLLAAGIGNIGNRIAANRLATAYGQAGDILANAYGQLRGIDMSAINRNDFRSAHAMAALQAPIVNTSAERTAAERSLQRNLKRINRGTLSSAAAQNRSARAEIDYNDRIGQIETNADRLRHEITQRNMERITQVANENANRDTQANQAYSNAYLGLLQYNNDIANERITGAAQARADAITQRASTLANMRTANAQSWAGAINAGGNAFANTLATNAKMQNNLDMTLSGGTDEAIIRMAFGSNGSSEYRNAARGIYERYKDGNDDQRRIAEKINRLYHFA